MKNSSKPIFKALSGGILETPPFWFMRQAGRYLPEYMAIRQEKQGFWEMAMDPSTAAEITLQPLRRFGMDGAIIFSDILTVPLGLGQKVEFIRGHGPKLERIETLDDINNLDLSGFLKKLDFVFEALDLTRSKMKTEGFFDQTTLIGFAGAPWTVATYMIEGGSSRNFMNVKKMAYGNPRAFETLIDILVEATASYLIEQIKAGAEVVQIFDSWSGVLDADNFNKFVVRPTQKIVEMIRDVYPETPIIGFPKGGGQNYLPYFRDTGVNAVSIDPGIQTNWAARVLQPMGCIQGNLDPVHLLVGGNSMKLAVERIKSDLKHGSFIFNLGHGIDKNTPLEHVEQLVYYIREN